MTFDEWVTRNVGENWQAIYSMEAYEFAQRVWEALSQPTDRHQGEPVAWLHDSPKGKSLSFSKCAHEDVDSKPLYTHADPGEVERLQFELSEARAIANGQTSLRKEEAEDWVKERDALRAHLSDQAAVLESVQAEFKRYGDRFPDGFDGRVFRWVDDAVAAHTLERKP